MKNIRKNQFNDSLLCYVNYEGKDYGTCWYFDSDIKIWLRIVDEIWIISRSDEIMVPFFALLKIFEIAKEYGWSPNNKIPEHFIKYEPSMKIDSNIIQKKGFFISKSWGEVQFDPNNLSKIDAGKLKIALEDFLEDETFFELKQNGLIQVPKEISRWEIIDIYTVDAKSFFTKENREFIRDFIGAIENSKIKIGKNRIFKRYFEDS